VVPPPSEGGVHSGKVTAFAPRCWPRAVLAALTLPLFAGCASHGSSDRLVQVNALLSCPPDPAEVATFEAQGDFPADTTVGLKLSVPFVALPLPTDMQSLLVDVGSVTGGLWGVADVPTEGDINLLLWSNTAPCNVTATTDGVVQGESLGMSDATHELLVNDKGIFLLDLTTGLLVEQPNAHLGAQPRLNAAITPFGSNALIAGGTATTMGGGVLPTAEVFVPGTDGASGTISTNAVLLNEPRAEPGALFVSTGPLTGDTVLVGGFPGSPSFTVEYVDPNTHASTIASGTLRTARTAPTVLQLTNGVFFVGGGFDSNGAPVSTVEWFDNILGRNLTQTANQVDLAPPPAKDAGAGSDAGTGPTATQYMFAPLAGGAVLAVTAWNEGELEPNVQVLGACIENGLYCFPTLTPAVPLDASQRPTAASAALFAAANSSPVLWTGTSWLRWDPWQDSFQPMNPASSGVGPAGFATLAADPGLATWVTNDGHVAGFRYDTRGPYTSDSQIDQENTAPDRVVAPSLVSAPAAIWGAPGYQAGLTLTNSATGSTLPAQVFVTDATFDDFTITATMLNAAGVILRDATGGEYVVGSDCPYVAFPGVGTYEITRSGPNLTVTLAGSGQPNTCRPSNLSGRLSIGFEALDQPTTLQEISITRAP
jgi:hypothetical protein